MTARPEHFRPGDEVLVDAFGRWRPGLVVKILRTRIRVTYDLPSGARTKDFPMHCVRIR